MMITQAQTGSWLRFLVILAFGLQAPIALANVTEWIDEGNRLVAQGAYWVASGSCPQQGGDGSQASKHKDPIACRESNNLIDTIRSGGEMGENSYLASLAEQREPALECTLQKVNDIYDIKEYRDKFETDLAEKIQAVIYLRKRASNLENEMTHKSQLGLAAQPKSDYYRATSDYNKLTAMDETILGSIPLIETSEIKTFVRNQLDFFNDGKGPDATYEQIFKSVHSNASETLAGLSGDLNADIKEIKKGVATNGFSMSRAMKESLAQDKDLEKRFFAQHSEIKKSIAPVVCQVDAKYGSGALWRDRGLIAIEVGLTAASLGATSMPTAISSTALRGFQAAVQAGKISQDLVPILKGAGIVLGLTASASLVDRNCFQYQPQFKGLTSGDQCKEYSIESLSANNCAMNSLLMGMSVVGLGISATQRLLSRAGAVTNIPDKGSPSVFENAKDWLTIKRNRFAIGRPLTNPKFDGANWAQSALKGSYESRLGERFIQDLRGLESNQHWIDIGAGDASAIRQYFEDAGFPSKARVTAIGVTPPSNSDILATQKLSPTFRYLSKKYVEGYSPSEIQLADIISDVMGALHYSQHLDATIEKELSFLKVGGRLYTNQSPNTTILIDGVEHSLAGYFNRIQGIVVNQDRYGGIVLEKITGNTYTPPLKLVKFSSGTPPKRIFSLEQ